MTQDEKHAVALMRYGAIAPLISGTKDDFQGLDDYYRAAAEKPYPAPDGSRTMKDQWMASLDMRAFHSIDKLRVSLTPVKLLHKHDNSMIKRNKTYLCRGDE